MQFGNLFAEWLKHHTPIGVINDYFTDVSARKKEFIAKIRTFKPENPLDAFRLLSGTPLAFIPEVLLGIDVLGSLGLVPDTVTDVDGYSKRLAELIRTSTNHQVVREPLELLGTLISEPVVSIFESYSERDEFDYQEFIRVFHGLVGAITLGGSIPGTVGELASFGQLELLGKPINDLYFNLGLGFLGWQTLAPLLENGIGLPANRDVKRKFRQTRFTTSEALHLYHRNQISYEEIVKLLQSEGWRDIDIPLVVNQSFNTFNDSQVYEFYEKGLINESQLRSYLRANGWKSTDIDILVRSKVTDKTSEAKSVSLTTARKAYKLGTITRNEVMNFLQELGYTDEAINLELAVLDFELTTDNKELSVSQIKQAYNTGVITENEALTGLIDLKYTSEDAQKLFNTWKVAKLPKIVHINQSTLTKALVTGVLSADEVLAKLQSIGYSMNDAQLIIDTVSVKTGNKQRVPSVAQILTAMQAGIIPVTDAENRLIAHGYNNQDTKLLIDLSNSQQVIKSDEVTILEAFLFDALTEDQARGQLQELGATQDYINTRIQTYTNRKKSNRKAAPLAEVSKWFRYGLITEAQALERVQDNGLSLEDANLFLQAIGLSPAKSLGNNTIQDSLFYGVITPNEALELLRKTGLNETDANTALKTMQAAIDHKSPKATISALLDAARKQIVTLEEFEVKLKAYRLDDNDIRTYLALAVYEPPQTTIKLSKTDILKAYRLGEMDKFTAITFLEAKGYSLEEAELLVSMERKEITDNDFVQAYLAGAIDQETLIAALIDAGYSQDDIVNLLAEIG